MSTSSATRTTNTTTTSTAGNSGSGDVPAIPVLNEAFVDPNAAIVRVNVQMPKLTSTNIEAWFNSMGYWFGAVGINNEQQKIRIILSQFDPNVIMLLNDSIETAPEIGKRDFIQKLLVSHFADSEQRKLNRLLSEMPLGDKRPSELYYEMKRVAGNVLGETALKGLWAQRLPSAAQAVIAASSGTAVEFTKIADAIVDAIVPNTVQQVATAPLSELAELKAVIAELKNQINAMPRQSRSRSRQRSHTPANNSTNANTNSNECWYHQTYGRDARNCREGCPHYANFRSTSVSAAGTNSTSN